MQETTGSKHKMREILLKVILIQKDFVFWPKAKKVYISLPLIAELSEKSFSLKVESKYENDTYKDQLHKDCDS